MLAIYVMPETLHVVRPFDISDDEQRYTSNKLLISKGKNEAIENFSSKKTSFLCGLVRDLRAAISEFVGEQRFRQV